MLVYINNTILIDFNFTNVTMFTKFPPSLLFHRCHTRNVLSQGHVVVSVIQLEVFHNFAACVPPPLRFLPFSVLISNTHTQMHTWGNACSNSKVGFTTAVAGTKVLERFAKSPFYS
jgi:hypothetical protein